MSVTVTRSAPLLPAGRDVGSSGARAWPLLPICLRGRFCRHMLLGALYQNRFPRTICYRAGVLENSKAFCSPVSP